MIAKLRHFVLSSVLKNIYKSLILPYLTYGLVAWGKASKNYLNKIVVLQKRVLRLIYFVDRKEHAIPLFVNAKILPITFLYYEAVCKLMFDVHNDSAPSNITKPFTRTSNIHTYNTRSSTSQFFSVKYSRLKMQKKSLFACWCQSLELVFVTAHPNFSKEQEKPKPRKGVGKGVVSQLKRLNVCSWLILFFRLFLCSFFSFFSFFFWDSSSWWLDRKECFIVL